MISRFNILQCLQCIIICSPYTSGNSSSTYIHIPILECTLFRARIYIFGARVHPSRLAYSVLINLRKKELLKGGSWTIDGTFYIEYSCTYRIWNEIDITIEKGMIFCVNVDWQHRAINFPIFKIVEIDFFLGTKTHVQKF